MQKQRPVVGITENCDAEDVSLMRSYVEAVRRGGSMPFVLLQTADRDEVRRQLQMIDVLLLPGGGDIAPQYYGEPVAGSHEPNPLRDSFEWLVLDEAVALGLPVFGICRGLQLINIYFGGTLVQDMGPKLVAVHSVPDRKWHPVHPIRIADDSRLSRVLEASQADVNSTHHQCVGRLGRGLKATAWCGDIVEAVEHETLPIWAVQFHPERLAWGEDRLFTRLFQHLDYTNR